MVITLDAARRRSRPAALVAQRLGRKPLNEAEQPKAWTTSRIMSKIINTFNKVASNKLQQVKQHKGEYKAFHKVWIQSGIASIRSAGKVHTHILANWRDPEPLNPDTPHLVIATDGSASKGHAGWGVRRMPHDAKPARGRH